MHIKQERESNVYKYIFVIAFIVATFGAGFYLGKGQKEVQIIEKTGETQVVYQDRIVTVTKTVQPDGTVTETTKTEDQSKNTNIKTVDDSTRTTAIATQYKVGAKYVAQYSAFLTGSRGLDNVEIDGSRRLLGPVWIDLGIRRESAALGLSVEF